MTENLHYRAEVSVTMQTRSALVAYATETGNAFDYAEELMRLLQRIHFLTQLSQLDELDTVSK